MNTKIKTVSRFFRILFQISFIVTLVLSGFNWLYLKADGYSFFSVFLGSDKSFSSMSSPIPPQYIEMLNQPNFDHLSFTALQKLEGFTLSLVPLSIELLILYFLIRLFKLYEQGEIFSLNNVRFIRNIGYLLLIGQAIDIIYELLLGLLLSLQHGNGHGMAGITYTDGFSTILMGLMVILISWIMGEGCKLREEQQLTI